MSINTLTPPPPELEQRIADAEDKASQYHHERVAAINADEVPDAVSEHLAAQREQAIRATTTAAEALRLACPNLPNAQKEQFRRRLEQLPEGAAALSRAFADPETSALFRDVDFDSPGLEKPSLKVPDSIDDAMMAEAFAHCIADSWRYIAATGEWLNWNGRAWQTDTTEQIHEACRQWVIDVGISAFESGADDEKVRKIAKYRHRSRLEAVVIIARRIEPIPASPDEFDRNPHLLNVANGIIDLRTGELLPHMPHAMIRKLAPVAYIPDAVSDDWAKALSMFGPEVRRYLQTLIGYASTGSVDEDVLSIWHGPGGDGKTTLISAIAAALGDYAGPLDSRLIMAEGFETHPTGLADLQGKRLVWLSETAEDGTLRTQRVKSLTGGDRIKARRLYQDFFEFDPTHTLIIITNHLPLINSTERAIWRRLRLVPFRKSFKAAHEATEGEIADTGLRRRLLKPRAQEAVLAWIVEGAIAWYANGLVESDEVLAATNEWKNIEDPIGRFMAEELVFVPSARITAGQLYEAYRCWCDGEGRPPRSKKNFLSEFQTRPEFITNEVEVIRPKNLLTFLNVGQKSLRVTEVSHD